MGLAGFCLEQRWDPGWDWRDPMWEVPKSLLGSQVGLAGFRLTFLPGTEFNPEHEFNSGKFERAVGKIISSQYPKGDPQGMNQYYQGSFLKSLRYQK